MDDEIIAILAEAKKNKDAHGNLLGLKPQQINRIAEIINNSLELDIDHNVGDDEAQLLATVLPQCWLTDLTIDDTRMSYIGFQALTKALPQCQNLTSLTIEKTNMEYPDFMCLTDALPQCQNLTHLTQGKEKLDKNNDVNIVSCIK